MIPLVLWESSWQDYLVFLQYKHNFNILHKLM